HLCATLAATRMPLRSSPRPSEDGWLRMVGHAHSTEQIEGSRKRFRPPAQPLFRAIVRSSRVLGAWPTGPNRTALGAWPTGPRVANRTANRTAPDAVV